MVESCFEWQWWMNSKNREDNKTIRTLTIKSTTGVIPFLLASLNRANAVSSEKRLSFTINDQH